MDKTAEQIRLYNTLFKEYDKMYRNLSSKFGISECTMWILYFLRESDTPCTQKALCDIMLQSKQSINSALKKMEHEGFITLEYGSDNKKNKLITLTEKGKELAENTADKIISADKNAFAMLSENERTAYLELFGKHISFLKNEIQKL
ncbi:MAG: DUF4364 family protein [Oscillospiraceae bacterium]|nr:DUF4364 family protein [Oscillospiraceae bacterium]